MKTIKSSIIIFCCLISIYFVACKEEPIAVPVITEILPDSGRVGGKEIIITGLNFSETPGGNDVRLNGIPCTIISESSTSITVKTIIGVSTGKIAVTVNKLTAFSKEYRVLPHKFTFTPYTGKPGNEVFFTGENFPEDTAQVRLYFFDSIKSPILSYSMVDGVGSFKTIVPDSALTGNISISVGPALLVFSDSIYTVIPE